MKKLLLSSREGTLEQAWALLGECSELYGDNGGDPDGNAWLPSNQGNIPDEIAQEVVKAGLGVMADVLMAKDEGMVNYFHLAIPEEVDHEYGERLQAIANDHCLLWAHYGAYGAMDSHWVFVKPEEGV